MNFLRFLHLPLVVALSIPAQARLLESTQECDARYGTGQDLPLALGEGFKSQENSTWTARMYSASGLAIQIIFENQTAVLIRYANEAPLKVANSTNRPISLTAEEVTHLRTVNLKEGITWRSYKDRTFETLAPSMTFWVSSDEKSYAGYDRDNRQLFVCNDRFWNIVAEKLKKQAETSPAIRFKGL